MSDPKQPEREIAPELEISRPAKTDSSAFEDGLPGLAENISMLLKYEDPRLQLDQSIIQSPKSRSSILMVNSLSTTLATSFPEKKILLYRGQLQQNPGLAEASSYFVEQLGPDFDKILVPFFKSTIAKFKPFIELHLKNKLGYRYTLSSDEMGSEEEEGTVGADEIVRLSDELIEDGRIMRKIFTSLYDQKILNTTRKETSGRKQLHILYSDRYRKTIFDRIEMIMKSKGFQLSREEIEKPFTEERMGYHMIALKGSEDVCNKILRENKESGFQLFLEMLESSLHEFGNSLSQGSYMGLQMYQDPLNLCLHTQGQFQRIMTAVYKIPFFLAYTQKEV